MTVPCRFDPVPVNMYGSARRQCGRKTRYATAAQARVAILRAKRAGKRQKAYHCTICGGWHVTTKREST